MKYYVMLFLLFLGMYIAPLGLRPMITPDEFRYAEIPREMVETGNWVVPRLAGMDYFEKPALGYQYMTHESIMPINLLSLQSQSPVSETQVHVLSCSVMSTEYNPPGSEFSRQEYWSVLPFLF